MYSFEKYEKSLPMQIIKGILIISGAIGTLWGIYRVFDLIHANLGSKYRPTEEFDNFLENLADFIKNEIKI
jgi:hypothetical protein